MLEICNLTKRFQGITAVDNVSFTIRPGEILGYIGPNGAGKSTTVKMIVGLLEPSDGQILFDGRTFSRVDRVSRCRLTSLLFVAGFGEQ